jgi:DNA-binding HxlR family transcriptional regulator
LFASDEIDLMSGLRSYGDPCGIARALDVIGERWALLIVRELLFGPKRFSDLRLSLGASPNVLSQRLGELEAGGIVQQRSAGGALYELTDWGRELHPIVVRLGRWGARALHRPTGALGVDALMIALESATEPSRSPGAARAAPMPPSRPIRARCGHWCSAIGSWRARPSRSGATPAWRGRSSVCSRARELTWASAGAGAIRTCSRPCRGSGADDSGGATTRR